MCLNIRTYFLPSKSMNQKQVALNVVEFQMRKFQIPSFPMQIAETKFEIKPPSKSTHPIGNKGRLTLMTPNQILPANRASPFSSSSLLLMIKYKRRIYFPCSMSMPLESDIGGLVKRRLYSPDWMQNQTQQPTNEMSLLRLPEPGSRRWVPKEFSSFPSTKKCFFFF